MKRTPVIIILILMIITSCSPQRRIRDNTTSSELRRVEETEIFQNLNGFKVEKGRFYFSGIQEEKLGFFSLNLENLQIEKEDWDIGEFDLYSPIEKQESIIVNFDSELIHRKNSKDKRVDTDVSGEYSPNILLSPNKDFILYTKGSREAAALYLYDIEGGEGKNIKNTISEEAFYTFHYTTQWSNSSKFFIFNNEEIYDNTGKLYDSLQATSSKWSPNDEYIAFIGLPEDLENNRIRIGDWVSYIGKDFNVYDVKRKSTKRVFNNPEGFIDPVESIQWSKDSSRLAISEGSINRSEGEALEEIEYDNVLVYDIEEDKKFEVKDMKYNHYEFIFSTLLYGNNFGMREPMELVGIESGDRKSFEKPIMLNSKEPFVVVHKESGFMINGRDILRIDKEGGVSTLISLPWEVDEMYLDSDTGQLILINSEMELYLLKI